MMDDFALRSLIEEFASLQAAHRALAQAVHPSALAPVKEQSRALLIQLQALSTASKEQRSAAPTRAPRQESFERIRLGLKEQAGQTLAVLAGIKLPQLRASIPALSREHPEEVCGLVDVLLSGDLADDKSLRMLEYLITMLSTEEKGGRRVVTREPSHVTSRLRAVANQRMSGDDSRCALAERFIEDAMLELLNQGDPGEIRDRVRNFKQELGGDVLQPRILSAAVTYNAAIWNCVAAEIDSSRSIEQLTEGLLTSHDSVEAETPITGHGPEVVGSETFRRFVAALAARIAGGESSDPLAHAAAQPLALESIRGEDVYLFEGDEPDEALWLMRAAISVGLVLKHRQQVENAISLLGIDVELLIEQGVDELIAQMNQLARKRFAASHYAEAFRLSDVKTHYLATHAIGRRTSEALVGPAGSSGSLRADSNDPQQDRSGWLERLQRSLFPPSPGVWIVIAILVGFSFFPIAGSDDAASEQAALSEISPFLAHGQHSKDTNPPRFIGKLGRTWDYLGTQERSEVTREIGEHFARLGTTRITLTDLRDQVVASYKNGEIVILVPRTPGDDS